MGKPPKFDVEKHGHRKEFSVRVFPKGLDTNPLDKIFREIAEKDPEFEFNGILCYLPIGFPKIHPTDKLEGTDAAAIWVQLLHGKLHKVSDLILSRTRQEREGGLPGGTSMSYRMPCAPSHPSEKPGTQYYQTPYVATMLEAYLRAWWAYVTGFYDGFEVYYAKVCVHNWVVQIPPIHPRGAIWVKCSLCHYSGTVRDASPSEMAEYTPGTTWEDDQRVFRDSIKTERNKETGKREQIAKPVGLSMKGARSPAKPGGKPRGRPSRHRAALDAQGKVGDLAHVVIPPPTSENPPSTGRIKFKKSVA